MKPLHPHIILRSILTSASGSVLHIYDNSTIPVLVTINSTTMTGNSAEQDGGAISFNASESGVLILSYELSIGVLDFALISILFLSFLPPLLI